MHAALHATCVLISPVCEEFFSRDSRIADCTVRHLGVERPFSSSYGLGKELHHCGRKLHATYQYTTIIKIYIL